MQEQGFPMKLQLPLTALLLATAACAPQMEASAPAPLASAPTTEAAASTPAEEDARLLSFLDEGFDAIVATSPQFMTALGIKTDYDKLNDYTDAQNQRVLAMEKARPHKMKAETGKQQVR